jgi:hypothetical protein
LRSQAQAMKAGPDSLLRQAADTIEAQQYLLVEKQDQLLRAAEMIAVQTLSASVDTEVDR